MSKFRKKPIVINACKWEGDLDKFIEWVESLTDEHLVIHKPADKSLIIQKLEVDMKADLGDWIIMGVKGEFYPCKPDIFKQTYELVED